MANQYTPTPLFDDLDALSGLTHHALNLPSAFNKYSLPKTAVNDFRFAASFLYSYRGSQETFKSYRRELERAIQWAWFVEKKSLKDLTREDFENYLAFCQHPPAGWIGKKHVPRFIKKDGEKTINSEWRPFVHSKSIKRANVDPGTHYSLSQSALQSIFAVLSSFYNYLIQEDYTAVNPVAQIRQKSKFIRKQQTKRQIRRLSELQWSYVLETAERMANATPATHERTLFIMNALFGMYLRISELAASERWTPEMGHFYQDNDAHWWFKTVGKGNKERDIVVSDAMLAALKRYRESMGLSALPSPGDALPLVPKTRGHGAVTGTRHIRKIVQTCFDEAIDRMKKDGFNEDIESLRTATVHWLRHTGISEDVKIRPREHVRDDAGHSSSAITDRYIDIELRERHASGRKKLIKKD
jgi:site-specific recombinase XerD